MKLTTSTRYNSMDVVLALSLALKIHGTAQAIRDTARSMRHNAPYEHRPKLKRLAEYPEDYKVLSAAWQMLDRTVELFPPVPDLYEPPRCHFKPMTIRHHQWICSTCKHRKERSL